MRRILREYETHHNTTGRTWHCPARHRTSRCRPKPPTSTPTALESTTGPAASYAWTAEQPDLQGRHYRQAQCSRPIDPSGRYALPSGRSTFQTSLAGCSASGCLAYPLRLRGRSAREWSLGWAASRRLTPVMDLSIGTATPVGRYSVLSAVAVRMRPAQLAGPSAPRSAIAKPPAANSASSPNW